MSQVIEYIGCRSTEAYSCDVNGNPFYNMWLTDTEVIRCRDCKHFKEDGCRCRYFLSQYPSTVDGTIVKGAIMMSYVNPNGFCAWAVRRDG